MSPYTQTDPRLPRRRSSTGTTGRTNVYVSFGAQQPQGATTNSAGPNPLTRVGSPLPYAKPRKRQRAISVKSGAYRTSARTPVNFTVLDAIPMSNPYNNNHTNTSQLDFMNPRAVPAAANATIAQRGTCSLKSTEDVWRCWNICSVCPQASSSSGGSLTQAACLSGTDGEARTAGCESEED